MTISIEMQIKLMQAFETFMQVSILVPMLVVWRRRRYFSPPIRLASWYVYLSAFTVITAKLAAHYFHNNQLFVVGFNVGKMLLFAAVYYQVLVPKRWHLLLRIGLVGSLCFIAGTLFHDWVVAMAVARTVQITLVTGFALAYLDQSLSSDIPTFTTRNPIGLLSVGNLLYAAFAVTAANLDMLVSGRYSVRVNFCFITFASLIFNYFLTLALLRDQRQEAVASLPDAPPEMTFAKV